MTTDNRPTETTLVSPEKSEELFRELIAENLHQVEEIGPVDIVVGIPFYNEVDIIASVVRTVREGLEEYYPGQKAIIAAVGSPLGDECLKVLDEVPQDEVIRHIAFLLKFLAAIAVCFIVSTAQSRFFSGSPAHSLGAKASDLSSSFGSHTNCPAK